MVHREGNEKFIQVELYLLLIYFNNLLQTAKQKSLNNIQATEFLEHLGA